MRMSKNQLRRMRSPRQSKFRRLLQLTLPLGQLAVLIVSRRYRIRKKVRKKRMRVRLRKRKKRNLKLRLRPKRRQSRLLRKHL